MLIRNAERDCTCRGCGVHINRGESIFHNYSSINRGTTTIFCMRCMGTIVARYKEYSDAAS